MSDCNKIKKIENKQWFVEELVNMVELKQISKPKFQRQKKWITLPDKKKSKSVPNTKSFIEFLRKNGHGVMSLLQAKNSTEDKYINIDGNNRINAIVDYWNTPFHIFPEKLNDLLKGVKEEIQNSGKTTEEQDRIDKELRNIFETMSYPNFMNMQFHAYTGGHFEKQHQTLWSELFEQYRDAIEKHLKLVQKDLRLKNSNSCTKDFGHVILPIQIFINYTSEELSTIFEDINRNFSPLSGEEILASSLHDITDFKIEDEVLEASIMKHIFSYYKDRDDGEVLEGFQVEGDTLVGLNAYEWIIGLQKHCEHTYDIRHKKNTTTSLPFLFKTYEYIHNRDGDASFTKMYTSDNVNTFSGYVVHFYRLLANVQNTMFPESINVKLFNEKCKKKLKQLSSNNMCLLLCAVIGAMRSKVSDADIQKLVERAILYHFFVQELQKRKTLKDTKQANTCAEEHGIFDIKNKKYKQYSAFYVGSGAGELVKASALKLLSGDKQFGAPITMALFRDVLNELIRITADEVVNAKDYTPQFYTCALMSYLYKTSMPTQQLNNKFSIEHVFPRSTRVQTSKVNIHRLGNTIPIVDLINCGRRNQHIREYKKYDKNGFLKYIEHILPNDTTYDSIVSYPSKDKPTMNDAHKYNTYCEDVEQKYINNLLSCIF